MSDKVSKISHINCITHLADAEMAGELTKDGGVHTAVTRKSPNKEQGQHSSIYRHNSASTTTDHQHARYAGMLYI